MQSSWRELCWNVPFCIITIRINVPQIRNCVLKSLHDLTALTSIGPNFLFFTSCKNLRLDHQRAAVILWIPPFLDIFAGICISPCPCSSSTWSSLKDTLQTSAFKAEKMMALVSHVYVDVNIWRITVYNFMLLDNYHYISLNIYLENYRKNF